MLGAVTAKPLASGKPAERLTPTHCIIWAWGAHVMLVFDEGARAHPNVVFTLWLVAPECWLLRRRDMAPCLQDSQTACGRAVDSLGRRLLRQPYAGHGSKSQVQQLGEGTCGGGD